MQLLPSASDRYAVENILRTVTTEMGSRSGVCMAPLKRTTCQTYGTRTFGAFAQGLRRLTSAGLPHSVSQAWRIGRAIAICKARNDIKSISSTILQLQNGACLFVGKISHVQRVRHSTTLGLPYNA
jgi:DUF917 family protein